MIRARGLTKRFRTQQKTGWRRAPSCHSLPSEILAVDNVDLAVREGEIFGLVGPNGAGKTTLIKILSTLIYPDEGTAWMNGFELISESLDVRRSIGTLFSPGDRGFFWRLSGWRNLRFYASLANVPRNRQPMRIEEVLGTVQLESHAYRPYQSYSGGMKRRLAIAKALLGDPPILLLDEPMLHLDTASANQIRGLIAKLSVERRKTIMYSTTSFQDAAKVCHRVAILENGRILECSAPSKIKYLSKDAAQSREQDPHKARSEVASVTNTFKSTDLTSGLQYQGLEDMELICDLELLDATSNLPT